MSEVMMRLGSFGFSMTTAAYQEFQRTSAYTFAAIPRFGKDDALQSTGRGADTVMLPGVIYPEFLSGTGQLDALRALADEQVPQVMIDGRGNMLGEWVIEEVEERGSFFGPAGVALKQEFTVKLRRYQDDSGGVVGFVSVFASAIPVASTLASATQVAATAAKGPASMLSGLTGSLSTLTGMASQLGSQANTVLGAVRSGMNAAKTLQNAGSDAGRLLALARNVSNIPSVMNGLVGVGGNVSRAAGVASGLLSNAGSAVRDADAALAIQGAIITANKLNVLAVQVRTAAQKIAGQG
jgi:phage protein U